MRSSPCSAAARRAAANAWDVAPERFEQVIAAPLARAERAVARQREILEGKRVSFLPDSQLEIPLARFLQRECGVQLLEVGTPYLDQQMSAAELPLLPGGVHRVHMANLKTGDHELVAIFTGQGPQSREYRRGATLNFSKGIGAKYVELEITDRVKKQQPEFVIKEWE